MFLTDVYVLAMSDKVNKHVLNRKSCKRPNDVNTVLEWVYYTCTNLPVIKLTLDFLDFRFQLYIALVLRHEHVHVVYWI